MRRAQVVVAVVSVLAFATRLAAADEPTLQNKDRDKAVALSIGGTVASIGLVVAGVRMHNGTLAGAGAFSTLIAPAAGEIYAGKLFTTGMVIRLSSAGAVVTGVIGEGIVSLSSAFREDRREDDSTIEALIAVGAIGYATGILYDIATAGSAVDEYNLWVQLHVAPTVISTPSGGPAVGLGLGGSF
jgi:hypothetical protein